VANIRVSDLPTGKVLLGGLSPGFERASPTFFKLDGRVYRFSPSAVAELKDITSEIVAPSKQLSWFIPDLEVEAKYEVNQNTPTIPDTVYRRYTISSLGGDTLLELSYKFLGLRAQADCRALNRAIWERINGDMEDLKVFGHKQALEMAKTNPKAGELFLRDRLEEIQALTKAFLLNKD